MDSKPRWLQLSLSGRAKMYHLQAAGKAYKASVAVELFLAQFSSVASSQLAQSRGNSKPMPSAAAGGIEPAATTEQWRGSSATIFDGKELAVGHCKTSHGLRRLLLAALFPLLFGGCASLAENQQDTVDPDEPGPYEQVEGEADEPTVVSYDDYRDPLEFVNRPIFKFNHVTYRYVLSPLSRGYQKVVPAPVDTGLANFFHNLREPLYFLNNLFQLKPIESGTTVLRLGINSTVGLLGFFDPAAAWWDLEREDTTFGDTLARYGVGYGAYFVIPLLGPSDLRDGTSTIFEYFTHPLHYTVERPESGGLLAIEGFVDRVPELSRYVDVVEPSEDPYIFVRNLYLQGIQRDADMLRQEVERQREEADQ